MKRLLIIYGVWSPNSHARFTAIARHIKNMELVVFFQTSTVRYRKWNAEITDSPYKMVFLKNIGIPVSSETPFVCNINYNIYQEIKRYNPDRIIATGWAASPPLRQLFMPGHITGRSYYGRGARYMRIPS